MRFRARYDPGVATFLPGPPGAFARIQPLTFPKTVHSQSNPTICLVL